MSRKPRTPGGCCGTLLSGPRRGAPDRSRVGGSCGSCIGPCGCDDGGCGRGEGGAPSGRRSCPSGGRSLREPGCDGGRGRDGGRVEGCDVEGGNSGRAV